MANKLYPLYKQALLGAGVNLTGANKVKAVLVDTGAYVQSDAHQFLSSVTGIIGTGVLLANKTVALGVFDADDVTFTAVPAGTGGASAAEAIILYVEVGADATTPADDILIAYFDTATGLPVTPNGGDITIAWDNGANKIFAL